MGDDLEVLVGIGLQTSASASRAICVGSTRPSRGGSTHPSLGGGSTRPSHGHSAHRSRDFWFVDIGSTRPSRGLWDGPARAAPPWVAAARSSTSREALVLKTSSFSSSPSQASGMSASGVDGREEIDTSWVDMSSVLTSDCG